MTPPRWRGPTTPKRLNRENSAAFWVMIAVREGTGTFANELRHFSRLVDIVDDHALDRVREFVHKYMRDGLEVAGFELMNEVEMATASRPSGTIAAVPRPADPLRRAGQLDHGGGVRQRKP